MPSRKYTLRLPPSLDAAVQADLHETHQLFAEVMRDALIAYLASPPPTRADSADTVSHLAERLDALTTRVAIIEQTLIPRSARSFSTDFSVVLFRPDCMLASEQYPMERA